MHGRRLNIVFLLLFLLVVYLPVTGQDQVEVDLQGETSDDGIALRWTFTFEQIPGNGYHLYRRTEDEDTFQKITDDPLSMTPVQQVRNQYDNDLGNTLDKYFEDYGGYPITREAVEEQELQDDPFELIMVNLFLSEDIRRAEAAGYYYLDQEVDAGTTVSYRLTSVSSNGDETTVDTLDSIEHTTNPSIPTTERPDVNTHPERIELTWGHQKGYYFYHVYRTSEEDGELHRITDEPIRQVDPGEREKPTNVQFQDTDVETGNTYWYSIRIQDQKGVLSEPSPRVRVEYTDEFPPSSPLSVRVEEQQDDNAILVRWLPIDADDLAGYNLYRSNSADGKKEMVNDDLIRDIRYLDETVTPGQDHIYWVTAVDNAGNESPPGFMATGKINDRTPPDQVKGLEAETKEGKVLLEWDRSEADDLHSYEIQRAFQEDEEKEWVQVNVDQVDEPSFVDTLDKSVSNVLLYRVRALDQSFNESDWSEPVSAKLPDVTPPPSPILTEAVPGEHNVKLTWKARRPDDVNGMFVERTEDPKEDWERITDEPVSGNEFTDEDLEGGTELTYRILAVDEAGNVSDPSRTAPATPVDVTPPPSPDNVKTRSEQQGVVLTWDEIKKQDLAGYFVYRKEEGEWTQLSPLIGNTRFVDTDVTRDDTNQYAVEALDQSGNRSELSETGPIEFDP